jgi:hypothetical protein
MQRWLAVGMLWGCAIPREDFAEAKADALCDAERRCQRGSFHVEWTSMENCVTATTRETSLSLASLDFCSYDPEEAARCVARLRDLACDQVGREDWDEACDLVFDCGFAQ